MSLESSEEATVCFRDNMKAREINGTDVVH